MDQDARKEIASEREAVLKKNITRAASPDQLPRPRPEKLKSRKLKPRKLKSRELRPRTLKPEETKLKKLMDSA